MAIFGVRSQSILQGPPSPNKISPVSDNCYSNYENNQQDAPYRLIYYSKSAVHVSGNVFAHHQENLTVFSVSSRHQPAATWVNTNRYCKYSQVLLMIGENIARNI